LLLPQPQPVVGSVVVTVVATVVGGSAAEMVKMAEGMGQPKCF
jgi:hypothetical protein